jgi:SAM-dependent methyltransferase
MDGVGQLNAEQLEFWDGAGGERWIAQQARRDEMLGDFAIAALNKAQAKPGEVVLDIGCGCGETTAALAEQVGPNGKITGVDISTPILAEARRRLTRYSNVQTILADAASHAFPREEADLLFSRFGVMFFGDPVAAFINLRKAMKPSGRLVFASWRSPKENGWLTAPMQAVKGLLPPSPPPDPEQPGPFAFQDQERVAHILTQAGFEAPVFDKFDKMIDVAGGHGVEGAVQSAMELGPTARLLDGEAPEIRNLIAVALRRFFASQVRDGRVQLSAAIWVVSAIAA